MKTKQGAIQEVKEIQKKDPRYEDASYSIIFETESKRVRALVWFKDTTLQREAVIALMKRLITMDHSLLKAVKKSLH